jgi:hypothetical protein
MLEHSGLLAIASVAILEDRDTARLYYTRGG